MSAHPPPFQRFLDTHREVVWRYLVATVGANDADDCFQETFLAAMRAYPRLRADSNLKAWVLTIAQRKALDHFRARGRRAILAGDALPEPVHHDHAPSGPKPGIAEDPVWGRVRALPAKQRATLTLRYAGDLSHAEIAVALGCSEEAARRSAHEGLKKLRQEPVA